MANLYADANFYITEINFQTVHGNNVYDVAWAHTGNNTTANFTVLADNVISNVYGTGKALDFVEYEPLTTPFPSGNAFTTPDISSTTTSNTGSGMTIQVAVDGDGNESISITNSGSGYYYSESVTFPGAAMHRTKDCRLTLTVDDREGINYFPAGLTDAAVVANAVPLMNVEYGFS